jgi:hypothetical protein
MQKSILTWALLIFTVYQAYAQSLAVNTSGAAADASAMVDITSTTKGLLIPRMLQAERDLIGSPATGLMIYQTNNTPGVYQYNGTTWVQLTNAGQNWSILGNTGTATASNFLGSFDNVDVAFRTNNIETFRMTNGQRVGIGVAAPSQKLHVSDATAPNTATLRVSGLAGATTLALGTAPFTAVMVDANGVFYRGGTTGSPGTAWGTLGNAGTAATSNFLGSADNVDVAFRTNNTETFRMTNGQRLLIGATTPTAPGTQKMEVSSGATLNAIFGHSNNIGGWLGYETNISFGTPVQTLLGSGVYATNSAAGYTSTFSSSSGAATVAANITYSNVWMANYNLADNASASFNPSASYSQLNVTNSTLGGTQIALRGWSERGTTAGNPGYTNGIQGIANTQNQDAIGVQGLAFSNAGVSIGGYFEGYNYVGTSYAYAYVGGTILGGVARKIIGTGTVSEIIPTAKHGRVTLTAPESPEYWYQDYGSVKMINGKAHVSLDPILADVVFIDDKNPIRVFCTPVDMLYFNGVTIVNQTPTGFDLVELNGGTHSGKLDYQLILKPKTNYGEGRFPQAPGPSYLKSEKEPAAAKAKNNPADGRKIFRWPAETETYNYKPEDLVGVGEEVQGGTHHGMIKMADGSFKPANPVDKNSITNEKNK